MTLTVNEMDMNYSPSEEPFEYEMVNGETFEGKRIIVDNRQFQHCVFRSCHFVHGGAQYAFYKCEIEGQCRLSQTGSAHKAVRLMEALEPALGQGIPPL